MRALRVQEGSAPLEVAICADAEINASGADKTGNNVSIESSARRSMGIAEYFLSRSDYAAAISRYRLPKRKAASMFDKDRSPAYAENGKLIECPVPVTCGRHPGKELSGRVRSP